MFVGTYYHSVDEKGRVSIPRRFREVIARKYDSMLIIIPFRFYLLVYPYMEWETLAQKIEELPQFDEEKRDFRRIFFPNAVETNIDAQGRILLPQSVRNSAELNKEVVLLGMNRMFEIWSKVKWEEKQKNIEENIGDIISALREIGI